LDVGKLTVRYLPPIPYDFSLTKAQQSRLVRRAFLEALSHTPEDVGQDISPLHKLLSLLANLVVIYLHVQLYYLFCYLLLDYLEWSVVGSILSVLLLIVGITVGLYVYFVYAIYWDFAEKKRKAA
jgi:hypothetical protein